MSKRKMITWSVTLLVALLVVEQFTSVNLFSVLFMKKEFESYKYLKDGVGSAHYEVVRVSENSYLTLTYDRTNNFFLLDDIDGIKKIDAKGEVKMFVSWRKVDLPSRTAYAFNDSLVFDFTQEEMKPTPFSEIIFPEKRSAEEWIALFESYYRQASIVIYGDKLVSQKHDFYPIYMKINGDWVLMYLHDYFYFQLDENKQRNFEPYPRKYNQLILLEDAANKVLSGWITQEEYNGQLEETLEYVPQKIKTLAFHKDCVSETIIYTPIPRVLAGTGYYHLNKGDEVIKFKENGLKLSFTKPKSYLYHFTVPKENESQCKISFLKLGYPTNANKSGSKGWYVIRRKTNH